MKASTVRTLNQIDADLSDLLERWPEALRRLLVDVTPGFGRKVPGNGDPPGGSGGHGRSITERLAEDRVTLGMIDDIDALRASPSTLVRLVHELLVDVGHIGAVLPPDNLDELAPLRRLSWCRWSVRQLIAGRDAIEFSAAAPVDETARVVRRVWHACREWGYRPHKPGVTREARLELAHDPTESWCRSCLRVGARSPRYRGELCRWCYEFQAAEGFVPPADLLEHRAAGKRITEAMVAPHRRRHRQRRRTR